MEQACSNILKQHFPVRPRQTVVILCDKDKWQLASKLQDELRLIGNEAHLVDMGLQSNYLDRLSHRPEIALAVLGSPAMWPQLQHYFVVEQRPTLRVKCNPTFFDCLLPLQSLVRMYGSDPNDDQLYLEQMACILPAHQRVRLTAPGGTSLTFTTRGWLIAPWEVHTSPVESTLNGLIVADASVFLGKVTVPMQLTIVQGKLTSIACADSADQVFTQYAAEMNRLFAESPRNAAV